MSRYFKDSSGFTLLELLVTISIMTVILTIVVINQSAYTDEIALTSLADEISSTVSQTQVYGTAVKEFIPGSSEFSASYGVSFSLLDSGSEVAYIYFADRNANDIYDGDWSCPVNSSSECLAKFNISRGNYVEEICTLSAGQAEICNGVGRVDITFRRPSTEANILFFNTGGQSFNPANLKGARIVLRSPKGSNRSVYIYNSGQISVQ